MKTAQQFCSAPILRFYRIKQVTTVELKIMVIKKTGILPRFLKVKALLPFNNELTKKVLAGI